MGLEGAAALRRPAGKSLPKASEQRRQSPAVMPSHSVKREDGDDSGWEEDGDEQPLAKVPRKDARTGRHSGVVKSFNSAVGIGRIACARMTTLVAVDAAELAGFAVGDRVTFRIAMDDFGNRKAAELEAA